MNKTFLLVGAILAFVYTGSYAMGGVVLIELQSIIETIPMEPQEYNEIIQYIDLFRNLGFFMLGVAALNIIAGFRLLAARKGNATKGEAIFWAVYLYLGAQIIGGVFATLGVVLNDFKSNNQTSQSLSLEQQIKIVNKSTSTTNNSP